MVHKLFLDRDKQGYSRRLSSGVGKRFMESYRKNLADPTPFTMQKYTQTSYVTLTNS